MKQSLVLLLFVGMTFLTGCQSHPSSYAVDIRINPHSSVQDTYLVRFNISQVSDTNFETISTRSIFTTKGHQCTLDIDTDEVNIECQMWVDGINGFSTVTIREKGYAVWCGTQTTAVDHEHPYSNRIQARLPSAEEKELVEALEYDINSRSQSLIAPQ